MQQPTMVIGSRAVEAKERYEVHDPATGEVLAQVPRGTAHDAKAAVEEAKAAFERPDWAEIDPSQRGRLLWKLGGLVRTNLTALAETETRNNGKTLKEAKGDVGYVAWTLEYFGGLADKIQGETIPVPGKRLAYTVREPMGVTAHIAPWNYPLLLAVRSVAPALAAGNTVVLKPASLTPLTALRFAELAREAGFPAGVLNVVTGPGGEVGDALVTHPDVASVTFTGSVEVGKRVAERAASKVKHVTLELGGKSPLVVMPDADLDKAAKAAHFGIFANAGQMCWATSRLLVHEKVHDEVVQKVVKLANGVKLGPGMSEATQMGPLVSLGQRDRVLEYVAKGANEGAKLVAGGAPPTETELAKGAFLRPTVFDGVAPDMTIVRQEIFGPVLAVQRFADAEEAVKLANATTFGLQACVYTRDLATAHALAARLHSGMVSINEGPVSFPMTPFGGVKESGLGREQGVQAAYAYTRTKTVIARFG
jgi:acyl-CoA reductase-like NAD-dependent aldehyde dehydrogenase